MQYKFKGTGKYVVGGNSGRTSTLKPGDVIDLVQTPSGVWASKFEAVVDEIPQPTEEEIAAQEAARQEAMREAEEARLKAELENAPAQQEPAATVAE